MGLEHPRVSVSTAGPGPNPPLIQRGIPYKPGAERGDGGIFPYGTAQGEGRSHLCRWQEEEILSLPREQGKWSPVEKSQGLSQSKVSSSPLLS